MQVSGSKCLPFYKDPHHWLGADSNPVGPCLDCLCEVYVQVRSDSGVPGRCKIWRDATDPSIYTYVYLIIFNNHFQCQPPVLSKIVILQFWFTILWTQMCTLCFHLPLICSKCCMFLCYGQRSMKPTRRCGYSAKVPHSLHFPESLSLRLRLEFSSGLTAWCLGGPSEEATTLRFGATIRTHTPLHWA